MHPLATKKKARKTAKKARSKRKPTPKSAPAPEPVAISMTAAAKALGVSRPAVRKAIDEGRLRDSVTRVATGKQVIYRIDLERARAEWRANTAPPNGRAKLSIDPEGLDASPADGAGSEEREDGMPNFALARARKEQAQAEKAELDVLERREKLVNRQVARRMMLTIGRDLNTVIESFPAKNSAALFSCKTKKAMEIKLEAEIAKLSQTLISSLESCLAEEREKERIA